MTNNTMALVVIFTRQALFVMSAVAWWLCMKTFELWFFAIENWSNFVSWWWFAVAPVCIVIYGVVAYATADVSLSPTKKVNTDDC